ncbi:AbrB/MazE/SpoVT family DNA-binding domain-containing protein [Pelagirhabdus alkalitolerans]|nr:AbrB/MazE/SpoVT family DNA-binding domain-containing protein [Pelagirhabdus alkalitolerans]
MLKTTIRKWGNSLGLRIPKEIVENQNIDDGLEMEIIEKGNQIILSPVKKQPTLDDLLATYTHDRHHDEIDWGESKGREI